MSRDVKIKLLKSLLKVKACPDKDYGICNNVPHSFETSRLLFSLFKAWPKFSGTLSFPVPHPTEAFYAVYAYYSAEDKWEGEYGALRMELLDFCINELEKELGSDAE